MQPVDDVSDRVDSGIGVPCVPTTWVEQLAPGGRLLTTLATRTPSWPGQLLITRTPPGAVEAVLRGRPRGHRPLLGYRWLSALDHRARIKAHPGTARSTRLSLPPDEAYSFWLAVAYLVPGTVRDFQAETMTIVAPEDESWAVADPGDGTVRVHGPRDLCAELEDVHTRWGAGRPAGKVPGRLRRQHRHPAHHLRHGAEDSELDAAPARHRPPAVAMTAPPRIAVTPHDTPGRRRTSRTADRRYGCPSNTNPLHLESTAPPRRSAGPRTSSDTTLATDVPCARTITLRTTSAGASCSAAVKWPTRTCGEADAYAATACSSIEAPRTWPSHGPVRSRRRRLLARQPRSRQGSDGLLRAGCWGTRDRQPAADRAARRALSLRHARRAPAAGCGRRPSGARGTVL